MLNQVLKDSHLVASIENLKVKKVCPYDQDVQEADKPLILICTRYLAVSRDQIWRMFLDYIAGFQIFVDRQFYLDLWAIEKLLLNTSSEEFIFGQPAEDHKDNQLKELFFVYAKCSPFDCDLQEISLKINPEDFDNRSTCIAGQLFRNFFSSYANYNFKHPNPFQVIRNDTMASDTIPVIEKLVHLMQSNKSFIQYLNEHTSLKEENLLTFLHENEDLCHLILMLCDLLNKTTDGEFQSTLILKNVSLQVLDPFIHPISLAIYDFYEQLLENEESEKLESKRHLPRITFLNLDGFDFEFNWKLLDHYNETCQYISIVDDIHQDLETLTQDKVFQRQQQTAFENAFNSYVVPIRRNKVNLNDLHFRHVLDTIVYPLINSFSPVVIIFSYAFTFYDDDIILSSKLFTEISTHLCVAANYKVIFMPRLMTSGIHIQDHQFEKQLLKTDHKNIIYYFNNYSDKFQHSFKFTHSQFSNDLMKYADHSPRIVKSNSFYEKYKKDNVTLYKLRQEKQRYMFEILSAFLEACRQTYLQEVKDTDKRMQDPNLQRADLLEFKIMYSEMMLSLHALHKKHWFSEHFKQNSDQIHTYKLLAMQHQKTQKREDSQFVSFLAQDLKDYVFIFEQALVQIFLRHLKSPVYLHSRLSQYFVNYERKKILFINAFSFKDTSELTIDEYCVCMVDYSKYNGNKIYAEIEVIQQTNNPIFFRSLCLDEESQLVYILYGKDARSNKLKDEIDVFNFQTCQLKTLAREDHSAIQFARAFVSSVVFSFSNQKNEIWTFGGSYLGESELHICNLVEQIQILSNGYRSRKINKEKIIPQSIRPMYGALMLQISDDNEKAILIIGGSQNEMLVNINNQPDCAYKFQKCSINDYYLVSRIELLRNPISCFSQNHNIKLGQEILIINDGTEIIGKNYRHIHDQLQVADPYSPYGLLSITKLTVDFGDSYQEQHHKMKFNIKPVRLTVTNDIQHQDKVYQSFAQVPSSMKFLYKHQQDDNQKLIYKSGTKLLSLNDQQKYQELAIKDYDSVCIGQNSIYVLNSSVENNYVYFNIYAYPLNLSSETLDPHTFSRCFIYVEQPIESIRKSLYCDHESLYILAGETRLKYRIDQLDSVLNSVKNTNINIRISLDTPDQFVQIPQNIRSMKESLSVKIRDAIFVIQRELENFNIYLESFTTHWVSGQIRLPGYLFDSNSQESQRRKLPLFLQKGKCSIIDHNIADQDLILVIAVQVENFIQILHLKVKVDEFEAEARWMRAENEIIEAMEVYECLSGGFNGAILVRTKEAKIIQLKF